MTNRKGRHEFTNCRCGVHRFKDCSTASTSSRCHPPQLPPQYSTRLPQLRCQITLDHSEVFRKALLIGHGCKKTLRSLASSSRSHLEAPRRDYFVKMNRIAFPPHTAIDSARLRSVPPEFLTVENTRILLCNGTSIIKDHEIVFGPVEW
jgi:hypothetical protein